MKKWPLVFGPGLVFALSSIGPGDLVSNSVAGATHGYSLLWALGAAPIFRAIWLNVSAKYVVVTGESLVQGYARVGRWLVWTILAATLLAGHMANLYMFVFLGDAAHMLVPLRGTSSATIWSLFFVALGFSLMFWRGYRGVEKVCRGLIAILGVSLVIAAIRSGPDPEGITRGLLIPSLPLSEGLYSTILLLAAIIGTEAGSMTNMIYAYFVYEKGWIKPEVLRRQRVDLTFSIVSILVMGLLMQIAAAGTLQTLGIDLKTVQDLGIVYSETQGRIGMIVFAVGLWAVAFSSFIGLTTGYSMVVDDIYRRFMNTSMSGTGSQRPASSSRAFRATVAVLSLSPLYIFLIDVEPVWLTLVVSSLFLLAIPVLAYGLLRITNDKTVMGEYSNSWFTNSAIGLLVLVAFYLSYRNGLELWGQMMTLIK